MSLTKLVADFHNKRVLVVGDVILDKYIQGPVNRISPEAPVQIVEVADERFVLGGAANVANNIKKLGAKVYLAGLVGDDSDGKYCRSILKYSGIDQSSVVADPERPTTTKVRITTGRHQIVRFDYEKKHPMSSEVEKKLILEIGNNLSEIDVVIFSDYAKGAISEGLIKNIQMLLKDRKIPLLVDPLPRENFRYGTGMTMITPNKKEAYELAGLKPDVPVEEVGRKLVKNYSSNVLVTRGEEGMTLFEKNGLVEHIPACTNEAYDIVGAGDTVVATAALALAANSSFFEAASLANYAASIVVHKVGTETVDPEELLIKLG